MQTIIQHIEQVTGLPFEVANKYNASGGSINTAFVLSSDEGQQYFVKTNKAGRLSMFEAEAKGLLALASSNSVKVPNPICYGEDQTLSYIVLEYMDISGSADQAQLGTQLAVMHQVSEKAFGWDIDNTIGDTHQGNTWTTNWLDFWREHRLGFQLQLASQKGYNGQLQLLGEKLLSDMPVLFQDRVIEPAMLHGDLWGGNVAGLPDGTPVIYDPAFYYGDREADIAMTYVFGGFTADFYASYQQANALDDGFVIRKTFYNIYHILNHLNMFGGGYHGQVINMMEQVLAEI